MLFSQNAKLGSEWEALRLTPVVVNLYISAADCVFRLVSSLRAGTGGEMAGQVPVPLISENAPGTLIIVAD